ncbi:general odorant-binding protein 70 [Lutzomyia longipalpis]|uniref:general odorant-binding protein 70 n=1 Tax=Lutzomyia longipalpis TaxID=7200 RepID=UPI002483B7ED|nr:general odorant-binding protein 70 [Lutzomyia longipalpis]
MRLIVLIIFLGTAECFFLGFTKKIQKCSRLPNVDKKIEEALGECKEEVKYEFARETLQIFGGQQQQFGVYGYGPLAPLAPLAPLEPSALNPTPVAPPVAPGNVLRRTRRDTEDYQHPTTVSHLERRLAGCLLRCFFKKNKALNYFGYPTLYGLVRIYTDGVSDHEYFMTVLQASEECLHGIFRKYSARQSNDDRESCDVAFDVFDCLSDKITEYCSDPFQLLNDLH